MPSINDDHEPWTYDYETLTNAPAQQHRPVAWPTSLLTGRDVKATWSANWTDDLGGGPKLTQDEPVLQKLSDQITLDVEQTFLFHLPRICEHCPNPACAASCPAGAIYERAEDGIVLVDQDRCGGWRMCVTGCPYNHRIGKAEKCTFCFPRIEVGLPMICAETCIGRLRYIAVVLWDADKVLGAVNVGDDKDLDRAQREVFLDPGDPAVQCAAQEAGIRRDPERPRSARRSGR